MKEPADGNLLPLFATLWGRSMGWDLWGGAPGEGDMGWGECCVVWENYVDMCVHVFIVDICMGMYSGFLLVGRRGISQSLQREVFHW